MKKDNVSIDWMGATLLTAGVSVLLIWDMFVAVTLGSARALERMGRFLPWLTRLAGGFLVLFGAGMIVSLATQLTR